MKDVDLVCDMITVCRERLETDLQYEKPLCDLIKVFGLVSDTCTYPWGKVGEKNYKPKTRY